MLVVVVVLVVFREVLTVEDAVNGPSWATAKLTSKLEKNKTEMERQTKITTRKHLPSLFCFILSSSKQV
jgi:hypothetical protein